LKVSQLCGWQKKKKKKEHCLPKISIKNPLNKAKTNRNKVVIDQCNESS
jgi:hypothetical protein